MQALDWIRDLQDQWAQDRTQKRIRRARRAWRELFLVPLRGESLEQRILLAADFGDAPAPYPTLLSENGARHEATGPRLGATRDSQADGAHSAAANADGADEDGVTFGTLRVGALRATVTVNVQGGPAKLDAWIDFNDDGNWGGPGEQIFASRSVAVGDNNLTFDVPSWTGDGATFARFRLSSAGNLGPAGAAIDGEVEDFMVSIDAPAFASGEFADKKAITTTAIGARSVFAADVDSDGDMDVLSASSVDRRIAWYENDGSQRFTAHTITTTADGARSVFAADVDGDGDVDVLSASARDDKIAWYENDGNQHFFIRRISVNADGARSVFAADVDGDGDMDVLSASHASDFDNKIVWYENDGSQSFIAHTITTAVIGARSVFAADVDGDGDLDVLSASARDDKIAWFENDGTPGDGGWTPRTITTAANRAYCVFAADVDGDGDLDVLSAAFDDDKIFWYKNDGTPADGGWTPRTITDAADGAWAVWSADVDGDGDQDVLSASAIDGKIAWYENDGLQKFTARKISVEAGAIAVMAADIDGDGDLDVLSASKTHDTGKIAWFENRNVDFGDAPAPYPTLLEENGAKHTMVGPLLGATRDSESDGAHSDAASADASDEDGVVFGTLQVGTLDATLTVNVRGGSARLDAWIDFNGDGNWGGPGEQVFASYDVVPGDNHLALDVPSWARGGTTFARFRLSTAGGLGPEGFATDGEVEDYAVTISLPAETSGVFAGQTTITSGANGAISVYGADLDGDGDLDMLSASRNDNQISWYENDGQQRFTPHTISAAARGAYSVLAMDVDGDGDLDVLSASFTDDKIAWYENDGNQDFLPHTISIAAIGALSVSAADVDGDGDLDVLSASSLDDKIAWYENDGDQDFSARTISTAANGAFAVTTADVDSDGDLDVLSASSLDDKIAWYENDGNQDFTPKTISTAANGARSIGAADVDGDGDIDVLSASSVDNKIAWYENDGSQIFASHTISTSALGAWSVFSADLDGDGDLDMLSASRTNNQISWYENRGSKGFASHRISAAANTAFAVFAADVDGDRDVDVLSASFNDDKIAWYAQDASPLLVAATGAAVVEGSSTTITSAQLAVTDSDNTAAQLFYDVTLPPRSGQLQLTTAPGLTITSFTQADINAGLLVYRHDGSETTSDSFAFTIHDDVVSGIVGGTFNLTVTPEAGAPVLNTALSPTLESTAEDATSPASTLVSSLLNGAVTDPDAAALSGIAVTAAPSSNGTWEYSLNNGATWTAMGTVSWSTARLLPSSARIRFLPKLDFSGSLNLSYRAWDQTAGTAGGTLNVIGNKGGAKTLSFAQESAALTVTPVNDAPILNTVLSPLLTAINEDATSPAGTSVATLLTGAVTNVDAGAQQGIAVISASSANGTWQFLLQGSSTWMAMGTVSSTAARLLPSSAKICFLPKLNFNGDVKLHYRAWDQTKGSAGGTLTTSGNTGGTKSMSRAEESASLTVEPVNDKPVLGHISGSVSYVHDATPILLAPGATVTDVDSADFFHGQLRVMTTNGSSSSNRLAIGSGFTVDSQGNVKQGTTTIGKRVANGFGTSELVITFNSNAPKAIVQQLVRAITFKTVSGAVGQRKVVFTVSDGDGGLSAEVTKDVNVS